MNNTTAIYLHNISKKYEIHHEKPTLVEKFVKGKNETFWALKNINLTIKKGERVGIIGPNGSGKTTLLKIIAGITTPTSGAVTARGKIVSLIDLEAGFHEDLTGDQNIFLNGTLLGMTRDEIVGQMDSIIGLANINQFIDVPLYTYSQGMKLRLGFSIAIHTNPDILILDEGVAVGDASFQKQSFRIIQSLIKQQKTILLATHWMGYINEFCNTVITLNRGVIEIIKKGKKISHV